MIHRRLAVVGRVADASLNAVDRCMYEVGSGRTYHIGCPKIELE